MHTYMHAYIHACIHTCMHTYLHMQYIHTYTYTYIHTCYTNTGADSTYVCTYMHAYTRTCIHTYIRTYIHTYMPHQQRHRQHTHKPAHTLLLTIPPSKKNTLAPTHTHIGSAGLLTCRKFGALSVRHFAWPSKPPLQTPCARLYRPSTLQRGAQKFSKDTLDSDCMQERNQGTGF